MIRRPRLIGVLVGALVGLVATAISTWIAVAGHRAITTHGFIDGLMIAIGMGGAVFLAHGIRCWVEEIWPGTVTHQDQAHGEHSPLEAPIRQVIEK